MSKLGLLLIAALLAPIPLQAASNCDRILIGLTYQVVLRTRGYHGGFRQLVRKRPDINFEEVRMARENGTPEGPSFLIYAIGERPASLFGFENARDGRRWIPDVVEFNGAIKSYNEGRLFDDPNRILISYYSYFNGDVPSRMYIEQYAASLALPVSVNTYVFFHDMSYHPGAMLAPNNAVLLVQRQLRAFLKFIRFLEEDSTISKTVISQMINEAAFTLDEGNGDLAWAFAHADAEAAMSDFFAALRRMTHSGSSPYHFILAMAARVVDPKIRERMVTFCEGELRSDPRFNEHIEVEALFQAARERLAFLRSL